MIQFVLLSMQHTVVLSPPNQAVMFSSVHDKFLGFFSHKAGLTHTSRLSVIHQSWSGTNSNIKALKEDAVYASVTYVASVATPQLLSFIDMRM